MSWARVLVLRSIIPTARAVAAASSSSARRSWAQIRMAPSGRAQLVRDHGDELVLRAVGRLRVQPRLLLAPGGLFAHAGQLQVGGDARDQVARREGLAQVLVGPHLAFALLVRAAAIMIIGTRLVRGSDAQRAGQGRGRPPPRASASTGSGRARSPAPRPAPPRSTAASADPAGLHQPVQVAAQVGVVGHHEDPPRRGSPRRGAGGAACAMRSGGRCEVPKRDARPAPSTGHRAAPSTTRVPPWAAATCCAMATPPPSSSKRGAQHVEHGRALRLPHTAP